MTFTARIKRNSSIWSLWRQHARTSGMVGGVLFRWITGNDYVTGPLAPAQVSALQRSDCVQIEMAEVAPVRLTVPLPKKHDRRR